MSTSGSSRMMVTGTTLNGNVFDLIVTAEKISGLLRAKREGESSGALVLLLYSLI